MNVTTMIAESAKGWVDKDPYAVLRDRPQGALRYPDHFQRQLGYLLLRVMREEDMSTGTMAHYLDVSESTLNNLICQRVTTRSSSLRKVVNGLRELLAAKL